MSFLIFIITFNGWTKIQGDDGGIFRSKHGRLCHRCVDAVRWNADVFVVFFVEKNLRSLKCKLNKQNGKYRWFLTIQNWVIDATSTFCDIVLKCMCDYTDWFSLCYLFLSSHFKPRHPHHPHTHICFEPFLDEKILWNRPHQCIQACERMVTRQVGGERQGTADLPCHMVWRDVMQLGTKLESSSNVDQCISWFRRAKDWQWDTMIDVFFFFSQSSSYNGFFHLNCSRYKLKAFNIGKGCKSQIKFERVLKCDHAFVVILFGWLAKGLLLPLGQYHVAALHCVRWSVRSVSAFAWISVRVSARILDLVSNALVCDG